MDHLDRTPDLDEDRLQAYKSVRKLLRDYVLDHATPAEEPALRQGLGEFLELWLERLGPESTETDLGHVVAVGPGDAVDFHFLTGYADADRLALHRIGRAFRVEESGRYTGFVTTFPEIPYGSWAAQELQAGIDSAS